MQKVIQKNWRTGEENPNLHLKTYTNDSLKNDEISQLIIEKKHDE
jgi:hypothetical protein